MMETAIGECLVAFIFGSLVGLLVQRALKKVYLCTRSSLMSSLQHIKTKVKL